MHRAALVPVSVLSLSISLLTVTLLVGTALPVAGQRIDVIPTMPPAPVCPVSTAGLGPSPEATAAADPVPAAAPEAPVVGVIPPRRTTTPQDLSPWRGSWEAPWDHVAIAPRTGAAVVTFPRGPFRTILWGGTGADGRLLNDGVMIDDSGATRVLPAAPICPRRDFAWSVGSAQLMRSPHIIQRTIRCPESQL